MRRPARSLAFQLVGALLLASAGGCSQAVSPSVVQDAQTAARVKTVLVNDATLGVRPIEVTVSNGIVRLTGRVASEAEAQRAVELAQSVDGVTVVRSDLRTGGANLIEPPRADEPARPALEPEGFEIEEPDPDDPRLLAVGVSIGRSSPHARGLDSAIRIGPLVRLGSGSGLGMSIGFGWFQTDLSSGQAEAPVGRVRIRPVMAGLGYTLRRDRVSATFSLVGGAAFNSVSRQDRSAGPVWALDVRNSFAWRSGVSLWFELGERAALNLFTGHVVTRPRMTFLEEGRTQTRRLRGDTTMVNAGLVYKVF